MRETVLMIKWCGWLSLLFLVLTYVFSVHANVNKENSWINDIWLSDNFLITAFSGVFASLLVVLNGVYNFTYDEESCNKIKDKSVYY